MLYKAIFKFFDGAISLFTKHGIAQVIGYVVLLVCVGYTSYNMFNMDEIVRDAIRTNDADIKEIHANSVKHRREISPQINLLLNNLLDKYNADRAAVVEMHNGTNNVAGLPFIYGAMTYEQVRSGVDHVDEDYVKINLTRFSIPIYMEKYHFFCGSVEELASIDERFASRVVGDGVTYIAGFVLYGLETEIGYLIVTWTGEPPVRTEGMLSELSATSQRISNLLNTVKK